MAAGNEISWAENVKVSMDDQHIFHFLTQVYDTFFVFLLPLSYVRVYKEGRS